MDVGIMLEQAVSPVPGGTGRYAVEMAAALAVREGTSVRSWTAWHRDVGPARVAGVAGPRRLPLPGRLLTVAWERGVGPRPAPHRFDVLYCPTLLFPPRRRTPVVVTIHDAVPWTHPGTLTDRGARWHRAMAERAAATADAVVVPTRAVADELAAVLDTRRVAVVGAGVGRAFGQADADGGAARRARLGLPAAGYLLSLATLEPRKGLDVLLRAAGSSGAPDLPVVVVGQPGWGGVDPHALARESGVPVERLLVLGRIADRDLVEVVRGATALVVPSRAEGFGLPVAEAMSLGTPVVTSDVPALTEVGGGATLVVPAGDHEALADALARVTEDTAERDRMRAEGLRRAEDHTWGAAAARLASVLFAVVAGDAAG